MGIGAIAGMWGGWRDSVVMRMLDVVIAFPALVLALAIAEGLGPSEFHAIIALCFFSVPAFARLARAATLRVREQNYIVAAGLSGTGALRTLVGHITPNILPQLITFALLGMGITVVLEGALSFLGLGIPPPAPSWGNMIAQGQGILSAEPKYVLLPSAALFITVIALQPARRRPADPVERAMSANNGFVAATTPASRAGGERPPATGRCWR